MEETQDAAFAGLIGAIAKFWRERVKHLLDDVDELFAASSLAH
jgi:hypothetical protein